jgi:hypothetical protein
VTSARLSEQARGHLGVDGEPSEIGGLKGSLSLVALQSLQGARRFLVVEEGPLFWNGFSIIIREVVVRANNILMNVWTLLFLALFVAGAPLPVLAGEECSLGTPSAQSLQVVEELPSDLFSIRLKNGMSFELSRTAPGIDLESTLSLEQKTTFFSRRKEFLTQFVKFLAFPRLVGSMEWTRNKVKGCFGKAPVSVTEDLVQIKLSEQMQSSGAVKKMGYQAIARILQSLDREIWNDSHVFINAKSRATSFVFGFSLGVAAPGIGFYKMRGLQFDYGYDFETKKSFFQRHWIKQSLKSAVVCFESMLVGGILRQYQLDQNKTQEETTLVALPFGFAYRGSSNTVSFGYLSGLSLADVVGTGLMFLGHVESGAAILSVAKVGSLFSLYVTDASRTTIAPSPKWAAFSKRLNRLLGRKSCEDELSSK